MSGYVLGLDGGGTQTRVAVTNLVGDILGTGLAGACSMSAVTPLEAIAATLTATDEALRQIGASRSAILSVCAGVAGFSSTERRMQFTKSMQDAFPRAILSVVPDYAAAFSGGIEGASGVLIIAGTGSVAYGENAAGETHKTGAYGYVIDDSGSGYGVGRSALAAVLQAADGTGPQTLLTERVMDYLGLNSLSEIVPSVYEGGVSRVTIASLSQVVANAASEDDDAIARAILMRAGGTLASLAHGVTQRLFLDADAAFPVVQIGGLWNAGDALTNVFVRSLRRFAPGAIITPAQRSPVEGAVQRALMQIGAGQKNLSPS